MSHYSRYLLVGLASLLFAMPALAQTPQLVSSTPSSGVGASQTFVFTYSDASGATAIANTHVLFSTAIYGPGECWIYFDSGSRSLFLATDDGSSWPSGLLGSATVLENSQCRIALSGVSQAVSGTNLALTVPIAFKASFAGTKNIYMRAADRSGTVAEYTAMGTWTVPVSTDTQAPTTPTGLRTGSVTATSVALSWTASTDNTGVSGYRIYRNGVQAGTSASPAYTDSGLTAATNYTYSVSAYDAAGNSSPQSSPVSATTATATASTPQGNMLFASGFEGTTALAPFSGYCSDYEHVQGSDSVTGFAWPITVFNPNPSLTGILEVIGCNTPQDVSAYIYNTLETVTGHDGKSTRALKLQILKASPNTCCTQSVLQTAGIQDDVRDVYVRFWLKLDPAIATNLQTYRNQYWRAMWAMKTVDDYRIEAYIYGDAYGNPYWYVHGDNNPAVDGGLASYQEYWAGSNRSVPVPLTDWFLVEIYLHRAADNTGRFFWAVNGQTLVDHYGPNYGVNNRKINALMYSSVYNPSGPAYQWVDDLEIWNRPACSALPCGAATASGGSTTDTQPPSAPASLVASSISSSQINLSWTASTDNVGVAGYNIFRNGGTTPVATVISGTSYQDSGLASSTSYTYTVVAYDAAHNMSAASNTATAATQPAPTATGDTQPPSAPANLVASTVSSSQISLSWAAGTDNIGVAGYYVFRNGGTTPVATVSGTSYLDSGLASSTSYSYTVVAFDAARNMSSPSNTATATTRNRNWRHSRTSPGYSQ